MVMPGGGKRKQRSGESGSSSLAVEDSNGRESPPQARMPPNVRS